MSKVVKLSDHIAVAEELSFNAIRTNNGLSRAQAAVALGKSRAAIDKWDRELRMREDHVALAEKFLKFATEHGENADIGRNLLFGRFSLRMAREILGLEVSQMAKRYDYTESTWKKFEGNGRPLNGETMAKLESDLRETFLGFCE